MKYFFGVATALVTILLLLQALLLNPWWHGLIFDYLGQVPQLRAERMYLLNHFRVGSEIELLHLSANELRHVQDIDRLIVNEQCIVWLTILLFGAAFLVIKRRTGWQQFFSSLEPGFLTVGGVIVMLGLLTLIQFEPLFRAAHQLIFPNGNWEFDSATDKIIQLYPPQFFQLFFLGLLILLVLLICAVYLLDRLFKPRR
ncbi:MAG: TIGR01906 family membrane protein [Candidatus Komeilibacteria bacterium]